MATVTDTPEMLTLRAEALTKTAMRAQRDILRAHDPNERRKLQATITRSLREAEKLLIRAEKILNE